VQTSDSRNTDDPRPTWKWLGRFAHLRPKWLFRFLADFAGRVIAWRYRAHWARLAPQYLQFKLLIDGINAELYSEHLKAALDVLATHAPLYLRWLHRGVDWLVVNQLFMITKTAAVVDYNNRLLAMHPYTVWKASPELLGLCLVSEATRIRLGRGFRRNRSARIRAERRILSEVLACARALPDGATLVEAFEKRLEAFNTRFPEGAV